MHDARTFWSLSSALRGRRLLHVQLADAPVDTLLPFEVPFTVAYQRVVRADSKPASRTARTACRITAQQGPKRSGGGDQVDGAPDCSDQSMRPFRTLSSSPCPAVQRIGHQVLHGRGRGAQRWQVGPTVCSTARDFLPTGRGARLALSSRSAVREAGWAGALSGSASAGASQVAGTLVAGPIRAARRALPGERRVAGIPRRAPLVAYSRWAGQHSGCAAAEAPHDSFMLSGSRVGPRRLP